MFSDSRELPLLSDSDWSTITQLAAPNLWKIGSFLWSPQHQSGHRLSHVETCRFSAGFTAGSAGR
jgi:hypothetical protein